MSREDIVKMPVSSFFGGVQRFAGQALKQAQRAYGQADKATGGWLPGGGTASPLTRTVFPPQPFPGRSAELEQVTGVRGRFIDPSKTPTLVSRVAPVLSSLWGTADYANPLLGEVGMRNYQGGATPRERSVEFHELGHFNPKDKQLYSYLGTLGRGLQGISNKTGNLPPLDLLSGMALQHADAPEEDRAERFARRFAKIGGYGEGPAIYKDGTSDYGNSLRREGKELTEKSLRRMTDPYDLISRSGQFIAEQRAKPIQAKISGIRTDLNSVFQKNPDITFEAMSPETRSLLKEKLRLENELKSLGIEN